MSSKTTATTTTTASGDNNKKGEIVDDCKCSGGGGIVGGANSKKQTSTFGGNLTTSAAAAAAAIKKEHDFLTSTEGGDSGFISGPLSSEIEQNINVKDVKASNLAAQDEEEGAVGGGGGSGAHLDLNKLNIIAKQQQQEELDKNIVDSGWIDEDSAEEVEINEEKAASIILRNNEQCKSKQQQNVQANAISGTAATGSNEQMRVKDNVDSGMSEWFCNLSLQTDAATTSTATGTQQAGISMNNLNAAGRSDQRLNHDSNRQQPQQPQPQQQQQQQKTNLTSTNAWEEFYQQNEDGDTPLHLACISGYDDVVAALIRMAPHPCLFNIENDDGQTPLHLAALTARPKILRMLLIAGAEPTKRDHCGNTALHLACMAGEEQCVSALMVTISASEIHEAHRQYGHRSNDKTVSSLNCACLPPDLEIRNYDGERCVHLAAQAGHIGILRILVYYGADVNAREGRSGRTPLHFAIEGCNEDLANFLLDECQKLDLETETFAGLTAYQVACILDKSHMQNMLEQRGAEPILPPDSDYESSDSESELDDSKFTGDPGYFVGYKSGNALVSLI